MTVDDLKCLLDDLMKSGNHISVYDVSIMINGLDMKDNKQIMLSRNDMSIDHVNQTLILNIKDGVK